MRYVVEMTDTFGGEANYSWVRRAAFKAPSTASEPQIVRRAKRELGISGRHKKTSLAGGDLIRLDFPNACICVFIIADEDAMAGV